MKLRDKSDVQEINCTEVTKVFSIDNKEVYVRFQNAMTGIVNGKRIILDEVLLNNMAEKVIQSIKQNYSKYNMHPNEVIFRNASFKKLNSELSLEQEKEKKQLEESMIESYEPRFELEQVALNEQVKKQIRTAIAAVRFKKKMSEDWGMSECFSGSRAIILNFYGKAGTGKSMTAEAVAKSLGKKVYHINYSELESKFVGETPKNIRKVFECATRDDGVLVFDEADSFLGKRLSSVTQSADYGVNITRSVLLMELEKYTGVVVFTTNLIGNYDDAFKRRILLSVYFDIPDEQARMAIWKLHINEKMPLDTEISVESLAKRYGGISGADIKDMVFYAALYTLEQEKKTIDFSILDYAYITIKGRYVNQEVENAKVISTETITEEEYQREVKGQEG